MKKRWKMVESEKCWVLFRNKKQVWGSSSSWEIRTMPPRRAEPPLSGVSSPLEVGSGTVSVYQRDSPLNF